MSNSIFLKSLFIYISLFQISCYQSTRTSSTINLPTNTEKTQKVDDDEFEDKRRTVNTNRIYHNWLLQDTDKQVKPRNITPLRIKIIESDDIEIRFWRGFGESLYGPQVLILERKNNHWKAIFLPNNLKDKTIFFSKPIKSDWNDLWSSLAENEILEIPNSTDIGNFYGINDQSSVLVEVRTGDRYRSYQYPENNLSGDANQQQKKYWIKLKNICSILSNEFDVSLCMIDE